MYRLILFFLLCISFCAAQHNYPKNDFRAPLDIPIILSGTFGELRSNHFHSGIDIKTQQREGLKVYAIGDGYISRIKIQHWGFGKAIYLTHSNGYTSVYGHLRKLAPKLEAYLKEKQYEKETYEIQLYPEVGELFVKKGEVIAYSGNSGGSGGPHLHFEIRESSTAKPINPMHFGIDVEDTQHPLAQALFAYPLGENAQVNQSNELIKIPLIRGKNSTFTTAKVFASGEIGFGINSYDRQDLAMNKNGVYEVETFVNGVKNFSYTFDKFAFSESRYINQLIDYGRFKSFTQRVQRCFITPANALSIYDEVINDGKITIVDGETYEVVINIKDFKENTTTITIPVVGKTQEVITKKKTKTTPHYITRDTDHTISEGNVSVYIPKHTFYDDFYFDLKADGEKIKIHNKTVPAHKNFTISFDMSAYDAAARKKLFIARLNKKKKPSYTSTKKNGTTFSTRTKTLGTYFIAKDTIAPTVKPKNFTKGKWLSKYNYLKVKISDDLSGIRSYRGTINGKWVLFEYEPKTNTLTYNFNDIVLTGTKHNLKLIVTDNVGNNTTFTSTFFRKG